MIQFVHRDTGVSMLVPDELKDRYVAAGHKLAATSEKSEEKPQKTATRRRVGK